MGFGRIGGDFQRQTRLQRCERRSFDGRRRWRPRLLRMEDTSGQEKRLRRAGGNPLVDAYRRPQPREGRQLVVVLQPEVISPSQPRKSSQYLATVMASPSSADSGSSAFESFSSSAGMLST